jgi:hypothetical protein
MHQSGNFPVYIPRAINLTVVNGQIIAAQNAQTGENLSVNSFGGIGHTIEDTFNTIQSSIDNGADEIKVTYDSNGIPTSVYIDPDKRGADEEIMRSFDHFQPY